MAGTMADVTGEMAKKALGGVKVLDFSWAMAGPCLTKVLGQHGAEIIKIESRSRPEFNRRMPPYKDGVPGVNRSGMYATHNDDKYGISLDLKNPRGLEIARRLAARSDLVVENYSPQVMGRLGLAYEDLKKVKPDLVMLSLSMQGHYGPHRDYVGYGWMLQALTGMQMYARWPDRIPVGPGSGTTDWIASCFGLVAVLSALDYRRRTGKGQYIDLSEFESGVYGLGAAVLDYSVNKKERTPVGSRHPRAAPHGVYRCQGEDKWCAVAVFKEEEWEAFCSAAGNPFWAKSARFATSAARQDNQDELDRLVEAFTVNFAPHEVMTRLQSAGVKAGVVQTTADLSADPQLEHRQHYRSLENEEMGKHRYEAPPFRLSETPAELLRPAPLLGQDTEYVCKTILGMSEEEYVNLLLAGAFE